jgi:hypothetical protein
MISGERLLAHRVIWAIVYGRWPRDQIDHINGVKDDNRLANLREATAVTNQRNQKRHSDKAPLPKGVSAYANCGTFRARIVVNGKSIFLGTFPTAEEAHAAYVAAARRYFGEFARAA